LKVRGTDNLEAVRGADIIFLCVKPQVVVDVVREIRAHVNRDQLLISVAASVPTEMIERGLEKEVPVVRAMPNTPCVLGAGMTALCKGRFAQRHHLELASKFLLRSAALSSSTRNAWTPSPAARAVAYIYIILESLAGAGVKVSLPRVYRPYWPRRPR
jgi:pyrroline-5-carboxylate reductase